MSKQEVFLNKLKQGRQFTASALFFFFLADELVYISRKLACDHPFDAFTSVSLQGDLIELEKRFIEQYKPRYNVQQDDFNPFDYYRQHISMKLSGIQTKEMIKWKHQLPTELLKESMDRVIETCPDNPFGYLKWLLNDWIAQGYTTVEQVKNNNKKGGNDGKTRPSMQPNPASESKVQAALERRKRIAGISN